MLGFEQNQGNETTTTPTIVPLGTSSVIVYTVTLGEFNSSKIILYLHLQGF